MNMQSEQKVKFITEENVIKIVCNYGYPKKDNMDIENVLLTKASDKMLGFLADYWKLKVTLKSENGVKKTLCFFIKAVSLNASKADMVREMNLFYKEKCFYSIIKKNVDLKGVKPWSAKLALILEDAIVLEDLNALGYKSENKFKTFDEAHTKQALRMLARFHASSIVYEQKKSKNLRRAYSINEEFGDYLDRGGYELSGWFVQCMKGALAAVVNYSKFKDDKRLIQVIEDCWEKIWSSGLNLSNGLPDTCNVICHRDLWNNNILFHYKKDGDMLTPDDCVMVDFQAVRYQPPAGDVMLLLYCNLEPTFREDHMNRFLCYYYKELELILADNDMNSADVLSLENFLKSAEEQRLWGLIVCACLIPQIWLDDDLITDTFCDTKQFDEILSKDKTSFIKKMIENDMQYKSKVIQIFEEIVDRYALSRF